MKGYNKLIRSNKLRELNSWFVGLFQHAKDVVVSIDPILFLICQCQLDTSVIRQQNCLTNLDSSGSQNTVGKR